MGFPLQLAYALTIHKAQGMTFPRAVIDFGECEFAQGVSFVALSRVRTSDSLAIEPFPDDRLTALGQTKRVQAMREEDARLKRLSYAVRQAVYICPAMSASRAAAAPHV